MQIKMFHGHKIISEQVGPEELAVVWRELERVLGAGIPGDVVEFGCYAGTTSLFIRRLLDEKEESARRQFHVYDSFEGLPDKTNKDESAAGTAFRAGELSVSKKEFLRQFHAANLQPPIAHKGWFNELTGGDVPEKIAFAFLDGDFYDSIMDSLKLVWPRMAKGGVVLIDDYGRDALPGAERAVQDFFKDKPIRLQVQTNIAVVSTPLMASHAKC